ncbi:hypothetical protein [Gordonia sp. SND2]
MDEYTNARRDAWDDYIDTRGPLDRPEPDDYLDDEEGQPWPPRR